MRRFFLCASIVMLCAGSASFVMAHETGVSHPEVTFSDLGVAEPSVLPSNPLYVFKSIGRFFRRLVTFDPVKKAELELTIANETLAEAKKAAESDSEDARGLERAIQNYKDAEERLRDRLEIVRTLSHNSNIDALLDKVSDRVAKHEALFEELQEKLSGEAARANAEDIRSGLGTLGEKPGRTQMMPPRQQPNAPAPVQSVRPPQTRAISISNFSFHDQEIRIPVGTKVTWTNRDTTRHNVVSDDESGALASPLLGTDETYTVTFSRPGIFRYVCTLHSGMRGVVIVE